MALSTAYQQILIGTETYAFNEDQVQIGEAENKPIPINTGVGIITLPLTRPSVQLTIARTTAEKIQAIEDEREASVNDILNATGATVPGVDLNLGGITILQCLLLGNTPSAPFYVNNTGLAETVVTYESQLFR